MTIKDMSHLGTLYFGEGMLGFKILKEGGEYCIGDAISFYPCVNIDKYSVSDTDQRFLNHILHDIYEFTFKVISRYEHDYETNDVNQNRDLNHYLIELSPGFNVFHFNWTQKTGDYLKTGTLYRGFGRLSTCENPAIYNPKIDPEAMKQILCKGKLEKLQINGLWLDYAINIPLAGSKNDDDCGVISYDDVLESVGYPEDMVKFRTIISKYQNDQSTLESTAQNKNSDILVYSIRMV